MTSLRTSIKIIIFMVMIIISSSALFYPGSTNGASIHVASTIQPAQGVSNATYSVIFNEYGLPSGIKWSVTLDGIVKNSTGIQIKFSMPNGTYQYTVGNENGYYGPSIGVINVAGKNTSAALRFSAINTPFETIQLFFEGAGLGGIIGGTAVSMFMRKKNS